MFKFNSQREEIASIDKEIILLKERVRELERTKSFLVWRYYKGTPFSYKIRLKILKRKLK